MTTRTRYFVITSLLVMFVGVGTGLLAYYVGLPAGMFSQGGVDDLKMLPADANLVAYANLREVMDSELRQRVRKVLPITGQGQQEIQDQTGINIENDIDEVLACIAPAHGSRLPASPLVIAHGRFDTARIEGLMLQHGARVEQYQGARMIIAPAPATPSSSQLQPLNPPDSFSVAFMAPGVVAIGMQSLIRSAIDQKTSGPGVTGNADLMRLVRSFDSGDVWAVGRFDSLMAQTPLPGGLAARLPAITWFAANADVDSGVRGTLRADARDAQAASDLRDVIRGFIALARLQVASQPELKVFLESLTLGGEGNTVSLGFDIPGQVVDLVGSAAGMLKNGPKTAPDSK